MSQPEATPPARRPPAPKAQIPPELAEILAPSLQVGLGAGSRSAIVHHWGGESKLTSSDKVKASTLAGASAGLVGGALRGPRNILPAIAVFSIFGATGQAVVNALPSGAAPDDSNSKSSWLDSRWSPVTPMTDTEYATFIEDKILKLDVEVSMIDDQLAALRERKAQRDAQEPRQEGS
ncbi:hypothetical protein Sste5346_004314 [Sporothrix stenoceras]|uniref:Uncharacterized protein n=1 Tax=Sporothrix stenoceras TaxID=5173 RepID=A0ABR3ZC73_9PEZI